MNLSGEQKDVVQIKHMQQKIYPLWHFILQKNL